MGTETTPVTAGSGVIETLDQDGLEAVLDAGGVTHAAVGASWSICYPNSARAAAIALCGEGSHPFAVTRRSDDTIESVTRLDETPPRPLVTLSERAFRVVAGIEDLTQLLGFGEDTYVVVDGAESSWQWVQGALRDEKTLDALEIILGDEAGEVHDKYTRMDLAQDIARGGVTFPNVNVARLVCHTPDPHVEAGTVDLWDVIDTWVNALRDTELTDAGVQFLLAAAKHTDTRGYARNKGLLDVLVTAAGVGEDWWLDELVYLIEEGVNPAIAVAVFDGVDAADWPEGAPETTAEAISWAYSFDDGKGPGGWASVLDIIRRDDFDEVFEFAGIAHCGLREASNTLALIATHPV